MIELFEYASEHNISIEIIPESRMQYTYRIKVKREVQLEDRTDTCQASQVVCFDMMHDNQEAAVEWILDRLVSKLNSQFYLEDVARRAEHE